MEISNKLSLIEVVWKILKDVEYDRIDEKDIAKLSHALNYDIVHGSAPFGEVQYRAVDSNGKFFDINKDGKRNSVKDHIYNPSSIRVLEYMLETGLMEDFEAFEEFYKELHRVVKGTKKLNELNKALTNKEKEVDERVLTEDRYQVLGVGKILVGPKNKRKDEFFLPQNHVKLPISEKYTEWEKSKGYLTGDEWIEKYGYIELKSTQKKSKSTQKTTSNPPENRLPF